MKPVAVIVHWSESPTFPVEEKLYTFETFETLAKRTSRNVKQGYDKTKITVLFDDNTQRTTRLDLAPNDDHCFQHHIEERLAYMKRDPLNTKAFAALIAELEQIEFP